MIMTIIRKVLREETYRYTMDTKSQEQVDESKYTGKH